MKTKLWAAAAAAITIGLASATPASAVVFTAEGQTTTINFNGFVSPSITPDSDLHAILNLTLFDIDAAMDSYTFDYTFQNTSVGNDTDARLVNFGFTVEPTLQSASIVSGFFDNAQFGDLNVVSGQMNVNFCATDANNCTGAGNASGTVEVSDGIVAGRFVLNFASPTTSVTLDDHIVRWVTIGDDNQGSGYGVPVGGVIDPRGLVPEPATWAMMIGGFFGMGAVLRRRRLVAA